MSSDTVFRIDELRKEFGGLVAVDDLSFDLQDDEILGLIGPNGSGKSTVFNCIMGIYDVTGGSVQFRDTDITKLDTHDIVNRGIARVSQESNPIPSSTVGENIDLFTYPNDIFSLTGGASQAEILDIARRFDLDEKLDTLPGSLPHADVRRLEIAKALATEPEMLLLDEPFAGMNQAEIRELSDQIRDIHAEGRPIIIVDHNMKGLMSIVDRVVVINSGQKIAEGSPEEIANDETVQKAYLAGAEVTN
ncbi:ABC transporter ATP-binding protein [Natrinema salsiterrestre]|uniref:ABC transporter ATP-binding protein n=1 Tax=Natrinema salsiterrestre TaxID=2950540 RepID=A0A9Q4L556_9EURY|nr:ABC transporter ATP-binding protein [Natrinema salsiterrestre]MDF9747832.1 ABC transporter ATP-binding protein [Natrinema salsiterrestre]